MKYTVLFMRMNEYGMVMTTIDFKIKALAEKAVEQYIEETEYSAQRAYIFENHDSIEE